MGFFNLFSKPKKHIEIKAPVKNPYSNSYYQNMEKIEVMWSVIKNLDLMQSKEAEIFEKLCISNKCDYIKMNEFDKKHNKDYVIPPHAPAFVRLAMLYEKQEQWQKAINICAEAIRNGAIEDGSKGKMYGRLARMIKKSGINPTPEVTQYISMR